MKNGMYTCTRFEIEICERIGNPGELILKITYEACPNEAIFVTGDKADKLFHQLKEVLETASKED